MRALKIPSGADFYIIRNADEGDWSDKGIFSGDKAYFKQEVPPFDPIAPFPFKTYSSPEEAIASAKNDPPPSRALVEATFGKLFLWNPKEQQWDRCTEPSIDCMGWYAVNFKIYEVKMRSKLAQKFKEFFASRAFKKALTWRVIALITLMIITFVATGSLMIAGSIGVADTIFKTILYWIHEKLWEKVDDGDSGRPDREPEGIRSEPETTN